MPSRKRSAHPQDEDFCGDVQPKPVITRREGQMPIINFGEYGLNSIPALKVLPAGEEKLRILEVQINPDRNGNEQLVVRCDVSNEPLAKDIYWRCHFPNRSFEEKRNLFLSRFLKEFLEAFELDTGNADHDTSDWLGKEGWATLIVTTDQKYGDKNEVSKWIRQH